MVPDVLLETVRREPAGARELGAERFVERDAVQGAHQRTHELGDEHAIARMPPMTGRQELDLAASDGRDELGHAFGARRRTARVQHDEDAGLRQLHRRKQVAESRVLPGQAVVRRHHAMERPQRVRRLHDVGLRERRRANQLGGSIGRAAVGVDHDGAQAREIARERQVHGADDVDHGRRIVQRRQAHQDVHLAHGHQVPEKRVRQGALVLHVAVHVRASAAGTSRSCTGPSSWCTARDRCAERCCRRTSRSGWRPPAWTDRAPRPARSPRGC